MCSSFVMNNDRMYREKMCQERRGYVNNRTSCHDATCPVLLVHMYVTAFHATHTCHFDAPAPATSGHFSSIFSASGS